jgi:hypothetical protein
VVCFATFDWSVALTDFGMRKKSAVSRLGGLNGHDGVRGQSGQSSKEEDCLSALRLSLCPMGDCAFCPRFVRVCPRVRASKKPSLFNLFVANAQHRAFCPRFILQGKENVGL